MFVSKEVIEFVLEGSFDVGQLESLLSSNSLVSEPLSQDRALGGLCLPNFMKDFMLFNVELLLQKISFSFVLHQFWLMQTEMR